MARHTFGGAATDLLIQPPSARGGIMVSLPNQGSGTAWSAKTGGTQYTDLVAVSGGTPVCTDSNGYVYQFQGPDGVTDLWVDFGSGARYHLLSTDSLGSLAVLTVDGTAPTGGNIALSARYVPQSALGGGASIGATVSTGSDPQQNVWLGVGAFAAATTAGESTAVGYKALAATTTGGANTAVGNYALTDNTTGTANTALGDGALFHNTSSGDNTAVGNIVLQFATAPGNTGVGSLALSQVTTGATNAAVGYNALAALTTGGANVAVGAAAGTTPNGVAANATKAGQQAVMIGYAAGCSDSGDLGYFVAIGANTVASFAAVAIGSTASASSSRAVAIGYGASASGTGAVAIGCDHNGTGASAAAQDQIALGTANHQVKISNNTTGVASAALGANCPATAPAAPYTWMKMTAGDGSTVYVPAWK